MQNNIYFTTEHPADFNQVLALYEFLGWNSLNLTVNELERMSKQSWYAVYAFDGEELVGMGRVISDGVITGVLCGVGVHPSYQSKGIGKEMINRMTEHCEQNKIFPQLMCVENLEPYYKALGYEKFTVGMNKKINR